MNPRNERHRDDPRPVQEGCRCPLCSRFSRAYLAHLFRAKELLDTGFRDMPQPDLHARLHGRHPR